MHRFTTLIPKLAAGISVLKHVQVSLLHSIRCCCGVWLSIEGCFRPRSESAPPAVFAGPSTPSPTRERVLASNYGAILQTTKSQEGSKKRNLLKKEVVLPAQHSMDSTLHNAARHDRAHEPDSADT